MEIVVLRINEAALAPHYSIRGSSARFLHALAVVYEVKTSAINRSDNSDYNDSILAGEIHQVTLTLNASY
jgi:hypothetical protein